MFEFRLIFHRSLFLGLIQTMTWFWKGDKSLTEACASLGLSELTYRCLVTRHWTQSSLVPLMAWHQTSSKATPEPPLPFFHLGILGHTSVNLNQSTYFFQQNVFHRRWRLRNYTIHLSADRELICWLEKIDHLHNSLLVCDLNRTPTWRLLCPFFRNVHLRENLARHCFTSTASTVTNSVQNSSTRLRYCDK